MKNKEIIKNILFLMLSVGLIVPLWGTFHSYVGIKTAWAAFASAALFFAAGHRLGDSLKVSIGHVLGVGWGASMLILVGRPEFQQIDPRVVSLGVLFFLGILAVAITHLGIELFSHLPSLFSGWAVTVGVLGGISSGKWGLLPVDIILALLVGVFVVGVGISQLHTFLLRVAAAGEDSPKESDEKEGDRISKAEAKLKKYTNSYKTASATADTGGEDPKGKELSEIKNEIISLKNTLAGNISFMPQVSPGNLAGVPVKVVGVCGSPHKKGSTIAYLKRALEAAESVGNVTTELIELAGKEIKPCMGCKTDKCHDKCRINDAMQEIYPVLRECDGIILGSPSYFGTFTGQLKLFIDRLRVMRHTDFQLGNKVVAPLAVAGRRHGGQEITNLDLIQSMMRHNTIIVNDGTAVCQLGATGWSHTFDDPGNKTEDDLYGMQTAEGVGIRVAEIAKVIKASGLQSTIYRYNAKIGKR